MTDQYEQDQKQAWHEQAVTEEYDRMIRLQICPEQYALDMVRAHVTHITVTHMFYTSDGTVVFTDVNGTRLLDAANYRRPETLRPIYIEVAQQYKKDTEGFPAVWWVEDTRPIYLPVLCDLWNEWVGSTQFLTEGGKLLRPFMGFQQGTPESDLMAWFCNANPDFYPPRDHARIEDDDPRYLPQYPRERDIMDMVIARLAELSPGDVRLLSELRRVLLKRGGCS